jgi:hypothetical protein
VDPFVAVVAEVAEVVDKAKGTEKVELIGERVGVAVAKKGVVGEGFVDEDVEVALVVETREEWVVVVPEEMICWFVAHIKIGRPIVSFAKVSMSFSFPLVGAIHFRTCKLFRWGDRLEKRLIESVILFFLFFGRELLNTVSFLSVSRERKSETR